jgi:PAS domain-containing protein
MIRAPEPVGDFPGNSFIIIDGEIASHTQSCIILTANQAFCKMTGYGVSELVGKKVPLLPSGLCSSTVMVTPGTAYRQINMLMHEPYASQHDSYMERYRTTHHARVLGTSRVVRLRAAAVPKKRVCECRLLMDSTGRCRQVEARHKDGSVLRVRLCLSQISTDGKVSRLGFEYCSG